MGLSFFPEPFADELLYSLMARVREMTDLSHHAVTNLFFGKTDIWVTVDLPLKLDRVASSIGREVMSCETLIERHTLLAYYMGFLERSAYTHARQLAAEGWKGVGPRNIKFHVPRVGRSDYLRFCTDCVSADKELAGIAGWRRCHQCPGVFVCPEHGTELMESEVPSNRTKQLICCPGDEASARRIPNPFQSAVARRIAVSTAWLLTHPQQAVGAAILRKRVRQLLVDKNWTTGGRGNIAREALYRAILKRYGPECLQYLGIDPNSSLWVAETYIEGFTHQKHPLYYLLLLEFLGLDSSALFDAQLDERVHSSEVDTTTKPIPRLHLQPVAERTILKHRARVEAFLMKTPGASRKEISKHHATSVRQLQLHDRRWIDAILPLQPKTGGRKVDWVQRDKELAARVLEAASTMMRASGNPRRVTRTRLLQSVGFSKLIQELPRLLTTAQALAASVEDELAFQRRRVRWAADCIVKEGAGSCTRAKLIKRAHRGEMRPELLPEIDELVKQINETFP